MVGLPKEDLSCVVEFELLLTFQFLVVFIIVLDEVTIDTCLLLSLGKVLSCLEKLLLDQAWYLLDKVVLAVVLILLKETFEVDELAMPDEWSDLNLQILGIEEGVLLVKVGNGDDDLIHSCIPEEYGKLGL